MLDLPRGEAEAVPPDQAGSASSIESRPLQVLVVDTLPGGGGPPIVRAANASKALAILNGGQRFDVIMPRTNNHGYPDKASPQPGISGPLHTFSYHGR